MWAFNSSLYRKIYIWDVEYYLMFHILYYIEYVLNSNLFYSNHYYYYVKYHHSSEKGGNIQTKPWIEIQIQ